MIEKPFMDATGKVESEVKADLTLPENKVFFRTII